jgi:alpha-L-fucosidase
MFCRCPGKLLADSDGRARLLLACTSKPQHHYHVHRLLTRFARRNDRTLPNAALRAHCAVLQVGRNSNLLLNLSPNTTGGVDAVDMQAYRGLGQWVNASFGAPKAQARDVVLAGLTTVLELPAEAEGGSCQFGWVNTE